MLKYSYRFNCFRRPAENAENVFIYFKRIGPQADFVMFYEIRIVGCASYVKKDKAPEIPQQ